MREIKFRAWDIHRSEWVKNTGNPYVFPFYGKVAMTCAGSSTGHIPDEDYSDEYILEQFTGLLDKNGTEIYEGDILATSNDDPAYDLWDKEDMGYTVVEWSDVACGFRGSIWDWEVAAELETIYSLKDFVEVVGNVHQNPELLK